MKGISDRSALGSRLSQFGSHNVVLTYRSVGGNSDDDVPPVRFRQDVKYLAEEYEIVDLPAAVSSPAPGKKIALTFDDGYLDFYEEVLPVLREFDAPATVFVISDALFDDGFSHDGGDHEYLTTTQLRELVDEDLVRIGNHTRTHPDLTAISDRAALESEIVGAKRDLERELSTRITRFSYPYGRYDADVVDVVSRSHEYAVAGSGGNVLSLQKANPCRLSRLDGTVDRDRLEYDVTDRALLYRHLLNRGRRLVPTVASPGVER